MQLAQPNAQLYIPDNTEEAAALSRTTHLAIGAHQDDLEIMAYHGILACFQQPDRWFTGVVVTNGAGSARTNVYENYSDEAMVDVRNDEQKKAAYVGEYAAQFLLDHPSGHVKSSEDHGVVSDYISILKATRPDILYTHNLADKHDTHIGVSLRLIQALRQLAPEERPKAIYGCEVWRNLDWMIDDDKIAFDVSDHENLQMSLVSIFDSQVIGGKRYDLATQGRQRANATYHQSHGVDECTGITFAMDLTPLILDDTLDPLQFTQDHINRLSQDITDRFNRVQ